MDCTGLSIFDIYGVERVDLQGEYTAETLAEALIDEWVPYFECHKCGRWDYCKYAKKHPANPKRSIDIKCGVAVDSLRNLINSAYSALEKMTREQAQGFLDGSFHFFGFVYSAEQWIGMNMDAGFHSYWGDLAPYIYSRISPMREHLNSLAFYWKELPGFKTKSSVLFVEGYSEKAFLDELKKSHSAWFLDLNVEVYGGKGNRKSKRIQMLLDRYKEQGYVVHAQGDADGENADIFRGLIESGSIEKKHTFVFHHDFESTIPLPLVYMVLCELKLIEGVTNEEFLERLKEIDGSLATRLEQSYGIGITPYKMEFAVTAADILNQSSWWNNDAFMEKTELGQFLRFIQCIE